MAKHRSPHTSLTTCHLITYDPLPQHPHLKIRHWTLCGHRLQESAYRQSLCPYKPRLYRQTFPPPRRNNVEHLPLLVNLRQVNSPALSPFRMNTCEKPRGGG